MNPIEKNVLRLTIKTERKNINNIKKNNTKRFNAVKKTFENKIRTFKKQRDDMFRKTKKRIKEQIKQITLLEKEEKKSEKAIEKAKEKEENIRNILESDKIKTMIQDASESIQNYVSERSAHTKTKIKIRKTKKNV